MIPFTADRAMIAKFDAAIQPFMTKMNTMGDGVRRFQVASQVGFQEVDNRANNTAKALLNVKSAAAALAAPLAVGGMVMGLAKLNDQAVMVKNQMQAIGISTDETRKKVFQLAIETRTPVEATVDLLSRMQKSLNTQSLDQTIRQVGTLNRLMATGGLDTNARASVSLQFGQALQSGVLQGDELRSLREAAPYELLEAIAKAAGGTVAQLRDLGSEGKLTRDVMVRALNDLEVTSRDKLGKFQMTLADASATMQTGMMAVISSMNEGLGAYDQLVAIQQGIGLWMADNAEVAETLGRALKIVFEASLVLAGSRGLLLLGTALTTTIGRMSVLTTATGAATAALSGLRAIMAMMGGPIGVALFAVGAAFMAWQKNVLSVNDALASTTKHLENLAGVKASYISLVDDIAADLKRLKEAEEAVAKAIQSQGTAAIEAATVEKQSIEERIEKNRALLREKVALAQFDIDQAKLGVKEAKSALIGGMPATFDNEITLGRPLTQDEILAQVAMATGGLEQQEAQRLLAYEAQIQRKISAGERLSAADIKFINDRNAILAQEKAIAAQEAALVEMQIASRDKLANVRHTGGDGSEAEAAYKEQLARAEAAQRAMKELQAHTENVLKQRKDFQSMAGQVNDLREIMAGYRFDGDEQVRTAVGLVAAEIDKAAKNVDSLDAEKLEALKSQVLGVVTMVDQFLSRLGLVRDELENPYKLYDLHTEAMPGSTDRGAWSRNAQEAAQKGILNLIGYAEGTDKGRGYNETLGYGKFTGGPVDLVNMSLREVRELQRSMLAHPDNTFNSSAVGRYQIVGNTLDGLVKSLGLSWDDKFDASTQDRMGLQLVRGRRGQGIDGMRNEWEGLRHVAPSIITDALGNSQIPSLDDGVAASLKEQTKARKELSETIATSAEQLAFENSIVGLSAAAQGRATTRFQLLNEAKRRGIDLDEKAAGSAKSYREQIEELAEAAGRQIEAEEARAKALKTAEERTDFLKAKQHELKEGILDAAAEGRSFSDVLGNLANALKRAALEALLFGSGPMAGKGGGSGLLGGLVSGAFDGISSLFFANGGIMTGKGAVDLPVRAYANGGIADRPQMAIFGEGSHPEAYVPLPDGRTIPVTLRMPDLGGMKSMQRDLAQGRTQVQYIEVPHIVRVEADDDGRMIATMRQIAASYADKSAQAVISVIPDQIREFQDHPRR